jgi:fructose-bisphosphate aldolase class I
MFRTELLETVARICEPEKGILAADESSGTIGKRFESIGVENTHENRVNYRDLLFTTPGLHTNISGVITYEETLFDTKSDGTQLIQPLLDNNIVVGIKVDKGVKPLYGTDGETVTQGMDDLDVRCRKYYEAGARFAKWRSVLKIDTSKNQPSELSILENAVTLARYASICIDNGLVPIVEPEILMDGTHTIQESHDISVKVLSAVYYQLIQHNVDIDCTLLKPNMVRPGVSSTQEINCVDIAKYTISAFQSVIPVKMPGVVFLSGGMSEMDASRALNEINKTEGQKPWRLTFSYGRALQSSVLKVWKGDPTNWVDAQKMLLMRARANGLASIGMYVNEVIGNESLHEKDYVY